jgi:hypothetical protein
MTTSSTPEDTIAECKRRVDECHTLSENTVVPEYRQALSAMAKAWMKIAQGEREHRQSSKRRIIACRCHLGRLPSQVARIRERRGQTND